MQKCLTLITLMLFVLLGFGRQRPLIWDVGELENMREQKAASTEAKSIIKAADKYCGKVPVVVVGNKTLHFAPDEHYFCSMGPYRWPDPKHPGQYVWRDGERNPDYSTYDSGKLEELDRRCEKLSKAFYITRDKKYYDAFVKQLCAWFIDEETYMYPNFEYSQVIPGKNNDKGSSSGTISAYAFNTVVESIRLVDCVQRINKKTYKALQCWFKEFAEWEDNNYGDYFQKVNNNISLAFDVTQVNLYLFAGERRKARNISRGFAERRIYCQIKKDGRQPEELKRTRAYSYSLYNLTHIIDFCLLMNYWDKNYYTKISQRVEKAFGYLQQYSNNPDAFPYQQISNWESCNKTLSKQLQRLENIKK